MSDSDFNYLGGLPRPGITLLEANAGTGKTFTIEGLVVRFVAEGFGVEELLVVTFTRAATSELRNRVRRRMAKVYQEMKTSLSGGEVGEDHELVQLLLTGEAAQVQERLRNLRRALANFDAATITTTHGFCEAALGELGLAGDSELEPQFVPNIDDIVGQVANDVYVEMFADQPTASTMTKPLSLVKDSHRYWDAQISPTDGSATERIAYLAACRTEIDRRKQIASLMTYDDQVARLMYAVTDLDRGAKACQVLRDKYRVVLVDEFQDTDLSQWKVLQSAFGQGETTLVLIGDPKQAIYSFRGADVYAYLEAAAVATKHTLRTNYRSSPALLAALDSLLEKMNFGHEAIKYEPSKPGADVSNAAGSSMRFRVIPQDSTLVGFYQGRMRVPEATPFIAKDVAADIVMRLAETETKPRDIAVLVNKHAEADLVAQALRARQVPAVIRGNNSVLQSTAGLAVQRLLEAIESPSSDTALRRLAATDLVGMTAHDIAEENETGLTQLEVLGDNLHYWVQVFDSSGVEAVFALINEEYAVSARILRQPQGERLLTDIEQVIELVGAFARINRPSPQALLAWLRGRVSGREELDADEQTRRLDTDTDAVQVITIHAAKGLQYDVVYCPYLWAAGQDPRDEPFLCHLDGKRTLFVGGDRDAAWSEAKRAAGEELRQESLRKAYVALTRAKRELVIHWGPTASTAPLAKILARDDMGPARVLQALAADNPAIGVEMITDNPPHTLWQSDEAQLLAPESVSRFEREVDESWRRTSFSSMTSAAHELKYQGVAGPEALTSQANTDEADNETEVVAIAAPTELIERVSLLSTLRGGTSMGSYVHYLFENCDFTAADLSSHVREAVAASRGQLRLDDAEVEQLAGGLFASITTPLGSDVGNASLNMIGFGDRIDEMEFELALAGGERPTGNVSPHLIADVLDESLTPDDPLRDYLPFLRDPLLATPVHGFLTGSIDLVLRTAGSQGPQYSVVDYKTNRLAAGDLTAWDYRPAAVQDAVFESHYPLQFLLYLVALHRYLRSRLPDYDPAVHLGPVKYLFVRGMFGSDNPMIDGQPCGVYTWRTNSVAIERLSELLAIGVDA